MKDIVYKCRVCGKPGFAEYEEGFTGDIDTWQSMLTHDRCYDFRDAKQEILRRIDSIIIWRNKVAVNEAQLERARLALVDATKDYCAVVCKFNRKPAQWEPWLVEGILKKPENTKTILWGFERLITR